MSRSWARRAAGRAAVTYGALAGLWIVASDRLLGALVDDAGRQRELQTVKGIAFVLVSALLFHLLLLRQLRRRERLERELERHAAELERRVAERTRALGETNAELEAFTYTVSHDLRAPLRAMQGFAQALLEDHGDRLEDDGRRYARRVIEAARRMDLLIRDLLEYSRLGRAALELGPLDLDPVVETALGRLADAGQVAVERPLGLVVAHRGALLQAVANLLDNALKFTRPGEPPQVRVRSERRDGRVRVWFEDRGIGIAPDQRERIFGVFERLHGLESYPGTGIGLAIVRKSVERMGGAVGVESEPGQGSRFWIELEAAGAAA